MRILSQGVAPMSTGVDKALLLRLVSEDVAFLAFSLPLALLAVHSARLSALPPAMEIG